jgi:hypothetical protein
LRKSYNTPSLSPCRAFPVSNCPLLADRVTILSFLRLSLRASFNCTWAPLVTVSTCSDQGSADAYNGLSQAFIGYQCLTFMRGETSFSQPSYAYIRHWPFNCSSHWRVWTPTSHFQDIPAPCRIITASSGFEGNLSQPHPLPDCLCCLFS